MTKEYKIFKYKRLGSLKQVNSAHLKANGSPYIPEEVLIDLAGEEIMAYQEGDFIYVEDNIDGGQHKLPVELFEKSED